MTSSNVLLLSFGIYFWTSSWLLKYMHMHTHTHTHTQTCTFGLHGLSIGVMEVSS